MQVLVRSLTNGQDVPVLSVYDDNAPEIDMATQPTGAFFLRGIDPKYVTGSGPMILHKEWRNDFTTVVNAEAGIRINECFPASMQSSAALVRQNYIMTYGSDISAWPPDAVTKNQEIQRGTDYITSVNAAATAIISSAPDNPCDDSLWPTPITPISLS